MYVLRLLTIFVVIIAVYGKVEKKVVCYYDAKSHLRQGIAKFEITDLVPALQYCTHVIYGYAAINEDTKKLIPLNEQFDVIQDNYRKFTDLKKQYPKVKFLLSVGGGADIGEDHNLKYRTLLESSLSRSTFINSAYTLIKGFGFDGLDLAWEFPETKPKKIRSKLGSIWHSIKKTVGAVGEVDENPEDHRQQFMSLVRELKNALRDEHLLVSLTVLPNVNSTVYYEPRTLSANLDLINLLAFDFYTPARNPKEADYPAPLYELSERRPDENVDAQVRYWLNNGAPANKIYLGVPTYGRTWTMDDESDLNGIPPLHVDGPGVPGRLINDAGLLSYPEICALSSRQSNQNIPQAMNFKVVRDSSKRKGAFKFRLADENNNGGIWIGYEDPDAAGYKADYARAKGLAGLAIFDLTLDDFKGQCGQHQYPLLRTVYTEF